MLTAVLLLMAVPVAAAATPQARQADPSSTQVRLPVGQTWEWPLPAPFRLERPFVAPAHEYGPGHRGIDLLPLADAVVRAPAGGVVAFAGQVAGRGVLTIDHGDGLVSTFEPVDAAVEIGTAVARGDHIGRIAAGGHAAGGRLHFGVRCQGDYINPLLLLDGVPRAVLLPCC